MRRAVKSDSRLLNVHYVWDLADELLRWQVGEGDGQRTPELTQDI